MRSPWKGGIMSRRWRSWCAPSSARIEVGPRMGRSAADDSPPRRSSSSPLNIWRIASGFVNMTTTRGATGIRTVNVSPKRRLHVEKKRAGRSAYSRPCTSEGDPGPGGSVEPDAMIGSPFPLMRLGQLAKSRQTDTSYGDVEDQVRKALQLGAQAIAGTSRGVDASAEHALLAVDIGERGDEGVRDHEERRRYVDLHIRHRVANDADPELPELAEHLAHALQVQLRSREARPVSQAYRIRVRHEEIEERVDEVVGELPPRGSRPEVLHDGLAGPIPEALEHCLP